MVFTAAALGDLAGPGSTQTLLNGALRLNPGLTHRPATFYGFALWLIMRPGVSRRPGSSQVTKSPTLGKKKDTVRAVLSFLGVGDLVSI